jgi:hypothetical protein
MGLPFLQMSNASIDFNNSELTLQHGVTSVQMHAISTPAPKHIKTTNNISIPPYSESNIKITLPSTRGKQSNAIAKPAPTFLRQRQLIGCHCLINNKESTAIYRVCNPT